jgi:hypothetical protein
MSMRRAEPPHGPRVASVSASFGLVRLGRTASQCVSHTLDDHETSARAAPATDVEDTFTRKRSEQFDKVPCDWLDERNATWSYTGASSSNMRATCSMGLSSSLAPAPARPSEIHVPSKGVRRTP